MAGDATATRVDATYFQLAHAVDASNEHVACNTPPSNTTELPTETVPRDPGKIVSEVASSAQRQVANSIAWNCNSLEQLQKLLPPPATPMPRLVAESNARKIELPSLEKVAESSRGVGGS